MMKSWLGFGDPDLIFKVTVGLKTTKFKAKKCLFAEYLMNRLADFNQMFMHITLGHDDELIIFWWPAPNFQNHSRT